MTPDKPSRPLGAARDPPTECPTSDVTARGEGMERLLSDNEGAEVLGTSVQGFGASVTGRGTSQWTGC
jgi:hypothetical protein